MIIVAYHRTGSTFTGALFQAYPGAFYIFEPLQAVSHFTRLVYLNGRTVWVRKFNIKRLVENELHNVMKCNFKDLSLNLIFGSARIDMNDSLRPLQECFLTQLQHYNPKSTAMSTLLSTNDTSGFERFFDKDACVQDKLCVNETALRQMSDVCLKSSHVVHHCKTAPLRAFKYIRVRLSQAEALLNDFPTLKIIYLLRDPRAATLSMKARMKQREVDQLSTKYCEFVRSNRNASDRLTKQHPDKLYRLQYEQLARDPVNVARKMYNFVGLPFLESVKNLTWRISSSGEGRQCNYCVERGDSVKMAQRWREKISKSTYRFINNVCRDVITEMGLTLPSFEKMKNISFPML